MTQKWVNVHTLKVVLGLGLNPSGHFCSQKEAGSIKSRGTNLWGTGTSGGQEVFGVTSPCLLGQAVPTELGSVSPPLIPRESPCHSPEALQEGHVA